MFWLLLSIIAVPAYGQVKPRLVERCGPHDINVACINHYSAVMPGHFYRAPINNSADPTMQPGYAQTNIPDDESFELLSTADFIVWDRERGLNLLDGLTKHELMFELAPAFHDAPVYSPETNELYISQLSPGLYSQQVVNLSATPPTMSNKTAKPPLYSGQGAWYHDGLIYYAIGGFDILENAGSGWINAPGIYTLNASSGVSTPLLNNLFGWYFNSPDDLVVDKQGDIWFTDPATGWGNRVNRYAPVIRPQTWHFSPSTGKVTVMEDSLSVPNGIALSPDQKTLYLSDTAAIDVPTPQRLFPPTYNDYNLTAAHTVYAFDLVRDNGSPHRPRLVNKRPIYYSQTWLPDGLKVSRDGHLLVGTGSGVDVLDGLGDLILSIPTNYTAVNMNWAGDDLQDLWIVGVGALSRVTNLGLKGPKLSRV